MLNRFLTFIGNQHLLCPSDRVLLTVSGGVDSMVMLNLFMQTDFQFAIAHCNFQLRGQDSIDDEQFVQNFAQQHHIELFTQTFDTKKYAQQQGISIEMAARDLRYNWFEYLLKTHHYTLIATAHHQNDVLETFFLNMMRTTGLSGLRGIKAKQGHIIRPMLFCDKNEIIQYALQNHIKYHEDKTNLDDSILRNYIRLHIIPAFEQLNKNVKAQMLNTIHILEQQENIYKSHIQDISNQLLIHEKDYKAINIDKIAPLHFATTYLYEILCEYGANYTQVQQIMQHLHSTEEKHFDTQDFKIIKTRNQIRIYPHQQPNKVTKKIEQLAKTPLRIDNLYFEEFSANECQEDIFSNTNKSVIYCDIDKLEFPLYIRTWQHGDYFYPLNGIGKKKLSDFFTDNKLSSVEKTSVQLLCNAKNDIVWIIGMKSDNRFKVGKQTNKILKIKLL